VASVFFFANASKAGQNADSVWKNVTISVKGFSMKVAQKVRMQEGCPAFTAWIEKEGQTVTDPKLGKSIQTNIVYLSGSSELVLPAEPVLSTQDENGCLVAAHTAWELFGSAEVVGQQIEIDHEICTIRGIVNKPKNGIYMQVPVSMKNVSFQRITLEEKEIEEGKNFLLRYGVDGTVIRMDYLRSPKSLTELVPGKWSDFDGWKANWKLRKEELRHIRKMHKNNIEYYYEKQCQIFLSEMGLGIFCILIAAGTLERAVYKYFRKFISTHT
jgi:hypothetical protein